MSADDKQAIRKVFLRMETDAELAERHYAATGDRVISWRDGKCLDDCVEKKGTRRRIVEDVA